MITSDKCPNCKKKLDKIPSKTINCPLCDKKIYVRICVKGNKRVLADLNGVKQIDNEWIEYGLNTNWFKIMEKFGVTKKDYMEIHDDLTHRWGFNPRHRDILWGLFNRILIESMQNNNQNNVKLIQDYMNKFKSEEKRFGGTA